MDKSDLTIVVLIKPEFIKEMGILEKDIINDGASPPDSHYGLKINSNGSVSFIYESEGSGADRIYTSKDIVKPDEWQFIAVVRDVNANVVKVYINDNKNTYSLKLPLPGYSNKPLWIGDYPSKSPEYTKANHLYFAGTIDELRIYNRALSDEEIKALYEQTLKSKGQGHNPTVRDSFDTDTGLWTYIGSAYRDETHGYVVLTEPKGDQVGIIWLNQNITSPFVAEFKYKAGGGSGADGLVFMFYKKKNYTPAGGGCLGFERLTIVNEVKRAEPVPGYGIEFDNFYNSNHNDPNERHIALIKDTVNNHLIYVKDDRTEDNKWHNVRVEVYESTIIVYVDGELLFTWKGEIDRTYEGIGFSAAVGARNNWHIIDDVKITVLQPVSKPKLKLTIDCDTMLKQGEVRNAELTIENVGSADAKDVKVTVTLPSLGVNVEKGYDVIPSKEARTITFQIAPNEAGKFKITAVAECWDEEGNKYIETTEKVIEVKPVPIVTATIVPTTTIPTPTPTKRKPVAKFVYYPTNPVAGDEITFDASPSYDIDGTIVRYEWKFSDGSIAEGKVVKHIFPAGSFTVTLTVIDNDGLKSTVTQQIYVKQSKKPKLVITYLGVNPEEVYKGETVEIRADVVNVGETEGTFKINLMIDGKIRDYQEVFLKPNEHKTISFVITAKELGTHIVRLGYKEEVFPSEVRFYVKEKPSSPPTTPHTTIPGFEHYLAILAISSMALARKLK